MFSVVFPWEQFFYSEELLQISHLLLDLVPGLAFFIFFDFSAIFELFLIGWLPFLLSVRSEAD
jgi:hypothetical protein